MMGRMKCLWLFLGVVLFTVSIYDVSADVIPSENECRPYIEKAIHELKNIETTATDDDNNKESTEDATTTDSDGSIEQVAQTEDDTQEVDDGNSSEKTDSKQQESEEEKPNGDDNDSKEQEQPAANDSEEKPSDDDNSKEDTGEEDGGDSKEVTDDDSSKQDDEKPEETAAENDSKENEADNNSKEDEADADNNSKEDANNEDSTEPEQAQNQSVEEENTAAEDVEGDSKEDQKSSSETAEIDDGKDSQEATDNTQEKEGEESVEEVSRAKRSIPDETEPASPEQDADDSQENTDETANEQTADDNKSEEEAPAVADDNDNSQEATTTEESQEGNNEDSKEGDDNNSQEGENASQENTENAEASNEADDGQQQDNESQEQQPDDNDSQENDNNSQEPDNNESQEQEGNENSQENANAESNEEDKDDDDEKTNDDESNEEIAEEELTLEFEIPKNLRSRSHISTLLGLDAESSIKENSLKRTGDVILKELKKIYDNAVKPLETLYKYRDLSNRHFGDPEIFSKPLVLFMGPWSGGKSTILNYLTDNEYTPNSIRSGAEPSPAYFNILMHGDEPEVMDGTQLAADWTFSGLQKFGQGLLDRLRGQRLPSKILERVNIVEIPGILEVRKQVSRFFPFNDACQWFIDRADIIFLVYDPSKLDVGPETEAILDQLKGREYQTRILLNKADQVKPEELLRVQGALIWNISPLMSSAQPPVMYTVSLWSHPFEAGSPVRLLQAQERALLVDLREAIDKRIENKIASARRFAVRIRNHAKMVDCYLTTYYNQKGLFSNKKQIADKIIENPQNYNIYEGLSTLTNISRYDLPDPEVYLDFFRLNPLFEFKKLSETCTYFKGCPINKLDIAIAYDLPELVGKYKKLLEENFSLMRKEFDDNCVNQSEPEPQVKIKSR